MAIGAISAASLSQDVLSSSNSTQLRQALQALQSSLASGDLKNAESSLQTVQKLNRNLAIARGNSEYGTSQLSTDLTALGSALSSGDTSSAQAAFATLQSDLKNGNSPSQTAEVNNASQSVQLVAELLSTLNVRSSSSSNSDAANSVSKQVYGSKVGLNVVA